jgi:hypothetical protein
LSLGFSSVLLFSLALSAACSTEVVVLLYI